MLAGKLGNRRRFFDEEDVNPMEGAINIVDAMLVFACGLMLSLVIYWNIDIQNQELKPAAPGEEVTAAVDGAQSEDPDASGEYEKMGTVYVDPATGKMYLVEDETGEDSDAQK